jgi:hypothetical protein
MRSEMRRGVGELACDRQEGKGPGKGRGLPSKDRRALVAGWGLAMYPMLPASSEGVDERFPCQAEMKAIFPVHVVRV